MYKLTVNITTEDGKKKDVVVSSADLNESSLWNNVIQFGVFDPEEQRFYPPNKVNYAQIEQTL